MSSLQLSDFFIVDNDRGFKYSSLHLIIIIILEGFIEYKFDTDLLMRLSPRREIPGTDMGQYPKVLARGMIKVEGVLPV